MIDDRAALAGELSLPADVPQHVLAAAAYRRLEAAMLSRLRGAFALVVWDLRRRDGLLAVDQLGARSLFYRRSGGSIVFATDIRELLPLLPTAPPPSERALVRWLVDGSLDPAETLFEGVFRVPGGHLLPLGSEIGGPEPYWRPSYQGSAAAEQDAVHVVRASLERAVARASDRSERNGVLLSGGLDSTAVAAVAGAMGKRLVAYSVVFPEHPATDESGHVSDRVRALGLESRRIAFRGGGALAAALRHIETWKLPPATPNLFFHEPLLRLARGDGVQTMLDGQGGDELFGASPYLLADRLRSGRLFDARRLARTLLGPANARAGLNQYAVRGALPASLHRSLRAVARKRRAPWWLTGEAAELYGPFSPRREWKDASGPRWWAYLADLVTRGRERAGVHDALRQMLADSGLRGAHPLLEDVDLIETVIGLPPELAFDERLDRPLLRAALADLVPDAIRLREEKSYFNEVLGDAVHRFDETPLRRLLDGSAEIRRYVNGDVFEALQAVPLERRGRRETFLLWRFATVESWLRAQRDPAFVRDALSTWSLAEPRFEVV